MQVALKKDQTGVTLTFDEWTNVKMSVVIMTSEKRLYVQKICRSEEVEELDENDYGNLTYTFSLILIMILVEVYLK